MLPLLGSVIAVSLSGVMMPGPMFAVTVARAYKSPFAGVWMSLGHAVVEVPLILLIYFVSARFFQHDVVQLVLSIAGGLMIIWMGIGLFRARKEVVSQGKDLPYNGVVAGIIMSAVNPFFILWWATTGNMLINRFLNEFSPSGGWGLGIFTATHWLCDLVWLSFVAVLVYRTKGLWGPRVQSGIFMVCSVALIGFGVWFVVSGVKLVV